MLVQFEAEIQEAERRMQYARIKSQSCQGLIGIDIRKRLKLGLRAQYLPSMSFGICPAVT